MTHWGRAAVAVLAALATATLMPAAGAADPVTYTGTFVDLGGTGSTAGLPVDSVTLTFDGNQLSGVLTLAFNGTQTSVDNQTTPLCNRLSARFDNVPLTVNGSHQILSTTIAVIWTNESDTCGLTPGNVTDQSTEQDPFQATVTGSTIDGTLRIPAGGGATFTFHATTTGSAPPPAASFGAGPLSASDGSAVLDHSGCTILEYASTRQKLLDSVPLASLNQDCVALVLGEQDFSGRLAGDFSTPEVRKEMARIAILEAAQKNGQPVLPSLRLLMPVINQMAKDADRPGGPPLTALDNLVRIVIVLDVDAGATK